MRQTWLNTNRTTSGINTFSVSIALMFSKKTWNIVGNEKIDLLKAILVSVSHQFQPLQFSHNHKSKTLMLSNVNFVKCFQAPRILFLSWCAKLYLTMVTLGPVHGGPAHEWPVLSTTVRLPTHVFVRIGMNTFSSSSNINGQVITPRPEWYLKSTAYSFVIINYYIGKICLFETKNWRIMSILYYGINNKDKYTFSCKKVLV